MFSKALYKQSWKANWIPWLAVTLVTSFVLMIIMLMSGGEGIGSITSSFSETFVKEELNGRFQNTAINYYYVSDDSLQVFDEAFLDGYLDELKENPFQAPTEENIGNAYIHALDAYQDKVDMKIKEIDQSYTTNTKEYEELLGVAMFVLNPSGMFDEMYEQYEEGSTPLTYDIFSLITSLDEDEIMNVWLTGAAPDNLYEVARTLERDSYRFNRNVNSAAIFMAGNMSSSAAREAILEILKENNISEEIYDSFGFNYDSLKDIASSAIVTFKARLDFAISKLDPTLYPSEEAYLEKVVEIKNTLQAEISATLITRLPEALADSMLEMQEYDVYTMTVGSMYFKIVGLLISVVYIIMVGVNLIAGQVDSGSMAYILSTGTKRNTVTITQMLFFVSSTFFIHVVTSIVAVVCFIIAPPITSSFTILTLLIFNLGGFLATMALGGIIFLASCIFNRSRHAMAMGGGFAILTMVSTILGMFASKLTPAMMRMDALDPFNKVSLISLVDHASILDGTVTYMWKFGILAAIAIITITAGIMVFKRKDLPL